MLARPDRARPARSAEPRAQAARLVPAVLSEHARERGAAAARRLDGRPQPCDDDGVRGGRASIARSLAGVIERRRHVPAADRGRRRRGAVRASCCARRAGDGASAPCSTPASTSTASRSSARRPRRSTCFCGPAPTRWRSVRSCVAAARMTQTSRAVRVVTPRVDRRRRSRLRVAGGVVAGWPGCSARPRATLREQLKVLAVLVARRVRAARTDRRRLPARHGGARRLDRRELPRLALLAALARGSRSSSRRARTASSTTSRSTRASARTSPT